jgi:hypothetical protein
MFLTEAAELLHPAGLVPIEGNVGEHLQTVYIMDAAKPLA